MEEIPQYILETFQAEARELLTDLESALLELEESPHNLDLVARVFRALHTIKGNAAMFGFGAVESFTHELETTFDLLRHEELTVDKEIVDLSLKAKDEIFRMLTEEGGDPEGAGRRVKLLENFRAIKEAAGRTGSQPEVGDEDREEGDTLSPEEVKKTESSGQGGDELPEDDAGGVKIELSSTVDGKAAGPKPPAKKATGKVEPAPGVRGEGAASVRVASAKLDQLVNLVGEMVTVQARLSQISLEKNDALLTSIAESVETLTWELRDNAFSIRMVPIGSSFRKFRRLTRDLSGEMGREAELVTSGAHTELDKTVIEKLSDPLVHLVRNAIDHGIESPQEREKAGKNRRGKVMLSASHSGPEVVIEVADDGRGLDGSVIREKAVSRGLLSADAEVDEAKLFSLVFLPGFSTAREVTSVSGRGVGLDVVQQSVTALRGSIDLVSEPGKGSIFTIRLPLTLAIIEGLQVVIGSERYIIPLSYVDECVELTREDVRRRHGRHLAEVRGDLVPYVPLRQWFRESGERPEIEQVVITRVDDLRVGLVVDFVVGEHQTVIKPLGRMYRDVEGLSGATVLGDGSVALILDVPQLVKGVEGEETASLG